MAAALASAIEVVNHPVIVAGFGSTPIPFFPDKNHALKHRDTIVAVNCH